jgi:integrase
MRLTDTKVRSLKAREKRYIAWEDGKTGFGVRVSTSGKKSFVFMYRFKGKPRMMTIGVYPEVTLASARIKFSKAKKLLEEGTDPGGVQADKKVLDRTAPTVEDLGNEFLEKWSKPRKKSWQIDERILKADIVPAIGKIKAKDIKRRDIVLLLDKIVDRGSPASANRTLAVISKMFSFAVSRNVLDASPCISIPSPGKKGQRDRFLSEDEIRVFWEKLETAPVSDVTKRALKFILVTGQRSGEVVAIQSRHIDLKKQLWVIPAELTKNGLSHRVPLTQMAIEILEEALAENDGSQWVFKSAKGSGHIQRHSAYHAIRINAEHFNLERFGPHDLRRTAATHLAGLEIPRLTISKILNHVEQGVTAIYDRHSYDREKRKALEAWSRKLETIITGKMGKIIELNLK